MTRAAVLMLLLCASAFAQNGDGSKKKPFRPPKLQPTTGFKGMDAAESTTSAGISLGQGSPGAGGSANDKGTGLGPGGMLGRLTPYVWSGEAKIEQAEPAPAEREGVRMTVRACDKGQGPVPDAKACCPLGSWYSYDNNQCWENKAGCMDGRRSSRCYHVDQKILKKVKEKVKLECPSGQAAHEGRCCTAGYWAFRGGAGCYAEESACSARSGKETCFTLDEFNR